MKLVSLIGNYPCFTGFIVRQTENTCDLKYIESISDIYELYNTCNNMTRKVKILCEAIIVYGFTKRALDFYEGYLNSTAYKKGYSNCNKKEQQWGKKTFILAAKYNHEYQRTKTIPDIYNSIVM